MVRYNFKTLQNFCNENKIQISQDYSEEKLGIECRIISKCISDNCDKNFDKSF